MTHPDKPTRDQLRDKIIGLWNRGSNIEVATDELALMFGIAKPRREVGWWVGHRGNPTQEEVLWWHGSKWRMGPGIDTHIGQNFTPRALLVEKADRGEKP